MLDDFIQDVQQLDLTQSAEPQKVGLVTDLVPSQHWPNGLAALEAAAEGARSLSVAVAFVTEGGVAKLAEARVDWKKTSSSSS